jgi:hypothetical protein
MRDNTIKNRMKIGTLVSISAHEKDRNVHRVLVGKTHGVRLRHRWEDNIETDFRLIQDKH